MGAQRITVAHGHSEFYLGRDDSPENQGDLKIPAVRARIRKLPDIAARTVYATLTEHPMITLYDYLPSQNAYKIRLLLNQLQLPYHTQLVSIFEGEGKQEEFLAKNPAGAVPVIELEDGRMLTESNAILLYLAEGTSFLPADAWDRAQVARWMFFEEDFIQNGIASLRHWTMTGKLARRTPEIIAAKRLGSIKTLGILERWLKGKEFLTSFGYTVADISVFAYVSRADEAGIFLASYPAVAAWVARIRAQAHFLDTVHPYSIDRYSANELP